MDAAIARWFSEKSFTPPAMSSRGVGLQSISNSRMLLESFGDLKSMSASSYAMFVVSSLALGLVSQTAVAQAQPVEPPPTSTAASQAPAASTAPAAPATPEAAPAAPETPDANPAASPSDQPAQETQAAQNEQDSAAQPETQGKTVYGPGAKETIHLLGVDKDDPRPKYPKGTRAGLGVTLGFTSGLGLSVRRHFNSGFGLQVAGFGVWSSDHRHLNLGTQFFYTFYRGEYARVYSLAGIAWHVNHKDRAIQGPVLPGQNPNEPQPVRYEDYYSHTLVFGPGIGGEVHLHPRFSIALEVPLAITIEEVGDKDTDRSFEDRLRIHPGINGAMHIYF